jgi:hypothetical protein
MSSKSKYNKRNVSQNKTESANPAEPSAQAKPVYTQKSNPSTNTATKAMLDMSIAADNFKTEIKWISLVSVLIAILLVVSFFLFR